MKSYAQSVQYHTITEIRDSEKKGKERDDV